MGGVHILVEYGFDLGLQDWPYLHCVWKHKILGNTCGLMYQVAVLLTNTHICIKPNQTSQCYSCPLTIIFTLDVVAVLVPLK